MPADKPLAATFDYAVAVTPGEQPTPDGFVRADYAATGFMLIRREVLERMAARHGELKYQHSFARATDAAATASDHLYALFDTSLDPATGRYLPEDYTFCNRCAHGGRDLGSRL